MRFLFYFLDIFNLECLNWANCNGDKCNGEDTIARGAIEKCRKNKILSILKTSLQNSQTFIAIIFLPQLQVHLEKPSAQECDLKRHQKFC
jgi:hypothetical protein